MTDLRKLGLLAGGGNAPAMILAHCREIGRPVHVIALEGFADHPALFEGPHDILGMTRVGRIIDRLKATGCETACLIGPVKRPSFRAVIPDARGARMLPKLLAATGQGDDAVLRVVIEELEGEGLAVQGADEILGALLARPGVYAAAAVPDECLPDIDWAFKVAKTLGALDVGQAVVVQQGVVLGVEGVEGTDGLLARCADLAFDGPGGVLVKAIKPQQERRADVPAIGPDTVRHAAAAGLRGIAVEAHGALMIDPDGIRRTADDLGLFVSVVVPPSARA